MINKWSKNAKLNAVLTNIENDLQEFGIDEIKRYVKEFPREIDFNIAQYGNLLFYYDTIFEFYKDAGYKSLENVSNEKIWNIYKRQVGYVARNIAK